MDLAFTLLLGVPCAFLLVTGAYLLLRWLNGLWDNTGYRLEHLILAPVRRFIWFPGVKVSRGPPCRSCDGLGVQSLIGGVWTIVPPELRTRQKDGSHPPLANTRRCPGCQGLGFRWVRET